MTQGRVTQIAVEAVIASTSGSVRVTQAAVEAVIAPTDAQARVTQIALEAVIAPTSQNLVVSQAGLEVARSGEPNLVVSQAGIEVARLPETNYVLISQAGIEVAWEVPKGTFSVDARLVYNDGYPDRLSNWFTVAATVKAGMSGSFSAASWLPGHFYANATKLASRSGSTTASAVLKGTQIGSFTAAAIIKKTRAYAYGIFDNFVSLNPWSTTYNATFVVAGPTETVIPDLTLIVDPIGTVSLSWDVWTSQDLYGVHKYATWRLRRTGVSGTVLASMSFESYSDINRGHADNWAGSYVDVAPTDGVYVITIQSTVTGPVDVYTEQRQAWAIRSDLWPLPSATGSLSNTVSPSGNQLIVNGTIETILPGCDLTLPGGGRLQWNVWTSQNKDGVHKYTIHRIRRGGLTGPIVYEYAWETFADNSGGHIDQWAGSYEVPHGGRYVLTIQSITGTAIPIYSDTRTFNAYLIGPFPADAVIMPRFSVDAYIAHHFSLNAAIGWYFQTDAVIFTGNQFGSFAVDSIHSKTLAGSTNLDAIQFKVQTGSLTADAVILRTITSDLLADSPIAYWRFNELSGTYAADATGSYSGTYYNSPSLGQAGQKDVAVGFNLSGTNQSQQMRVSHASALNLNGSFSIEMRVKVTGGSTWPILIAKNIGDGNGWLLYWLGGGVTLKRKPEIEAHVASAPAGVWTHIVVSYDHAASRLISYVNGVYYTQYSVSFSADYTGSEVRFGVEDDGQWLNGYIDEAALFNYALTGAQAASHYLGALSFTVNAVITLTRSGSFGIDYEISNGHFLIEAIRGRTYTRTVVLEAIRFERFTKTFSVAAVIKKTVVVLGVKGDTYPPAYGTIDADAERGFDVDAQIGKWFLAEALIVPLHFFADAVFTETFAGSFTAAAIRGETMVRTISANAVIKKTIEVLGVKGDVYPPAYGTIDYRWGPGGSITFDAVKFKTTEGATTLRAIQRRTFAGTLTAEAWKAGRFFLDAYIAQWFTSDAVLFRPGDLPPWHTFTIGAEKCLEFHVEAFIQPYFWVNADIQFGFVVDAVIKRAIGVPTMMPLVFPGSNQQIYGNVANVITPAFPVEDYLVVNIVDPPSDGGYMGAWNASLSYNYVITKLPGEWFYTIFPGVYYLYSNKENTYRPGLTGSGTYSDWGVSSLQFAVEAFIELRFSVDSALVWHFEFSEPTVDALVLGRIRGSFTAQAIIQWFFHLDALISYRHFLVDVWIQPEIHVDAWLIRRVTGTLTINAVLKPYFRVNAALKKTLPGTVTVNAFKLNPKYGFFTIESKVGPYFVVRAAIVLTKYRRFTAAALIRRTYPSSVPVESYVQPYFRVNAVLFRMEFFLYAVRLDLGELLDPPRGFTAGSAFVWHWEVVGPQLIEAFIEPYFRLNAIKLETFAGSFAVDCAIVIRRTSPIDYPPMTVNAFLTGFFVNATIFKPGLPRLFTVYAMFGDWERTGTFKIDAVRGDGSAYWDPYWEVWRYPAFTSDAAIRRIDTRSIPADAVITLEGLTQSHFNVNARLAGFGIEGEIWVEAFIEAQHTVVFEGEGETEVIRHLVTERLSYPGIPSPIRGNENTVSGGFYPPYLEPVSITLWEVPYSNHVGIYSAIEDKWTNIYAPGTVVFYPQREQDIHYVYTWTTGAYDPNLTGSGTVSYYRDDTIVLSWPAPTIDAWIVGTPGEPWTIDAEIIGREKLRSFIAGADLSKVGEARGLLDVSAYILGRRTFIFRVGAVIAQGTLTIDAVIYMPPFTAEAGFGADAVIFRTMATEVNLWQYAINAVIWRSTVSRSFRVGAATAQVGERNGYATIDADILGPVRPRRFYLAAEVAGNYRGFSVGAYIAPTFKLDAFIGMYFRVSAFIRGTSYIIFPEIPGPRTVTDAVISGTTLTSATANFTFSDTGRTVTGPGIPAGTTIVMVINSTTVIISQPATGTGVPVTIGPGGPTDPSGNEPNFSRSFRVKIEAGIPDTIPVGNDAEIERLIALILEAEQELDAMYCAVVHYKPQDQTTTTQWNSNPSGTGYNRGSLPGALSQIPPPGYPGAGDIDDCWVVATVWAAIAAGETYKPSVPVFRSLAGNPDRPGPTGGSGYHVWKGSVGAWPNHKIRKYTSSNWDGFISLLKAGWIASLGIRLSGLPSSHRYGYKDGLHQIGVAYQNGTYYYMDPNQPNGSAPRAVSGYELRTAARGFSGGTISATMFA